MNLNGIVVGDGPEKKILEQEYPNIEFTGWKNKEEVKQIMKKCRALILPSLWYEGAPLTPLEAINVGLITIINDDCAAREYVGKELRYNGYKELKEKINYCQNNNDIKIDRTILNKYSYDNYSSKLINYYKEILSN